MGWPAVTEKEKGAIGTVLAFCGTIAATVKNTFT
jgi:hypothetical protein